MTHAAPPRSEFYRYPHVYSAQTAAAFLLGVGLGMRLYTENKIFSCKMLTALAVATWAPTICGASFTNKAIDTTLQCGEYLANKVIDLILKYDPII